VSRPLDVANLAALIQASCVGLGDAVDAEQILKFTLKDLYDGVPIEEVRKCTIMSARSLLEQDPAYGFVTARLLLNNICCEVLGKEVVQVDMATHYAEYFPVFIKRGIKAELLDEELASFDLPRLAKELDASRDMQFGYLGLQTLYDRYFLHIDETRIELPQAFFMRVRWGWRSGRSTARRAPSSFTACCPASIS